MEEEEEEYDEEEESIHLNQGGAIGAMRAGKRRVHPQRGEDTPFDVQLTRHGSSQKFRNHRRTSNARGIGTSRGGLSCAGSRRSSSAAIEAKAHAAAAEAEAEAAAEAAAAAGGAAAGGGGDWSQVSSFSEAERH